MTGVLCVGEGLYELGLDEAGTSVREGFGGDAANTAVMASKLGASAAIAGRVGDDELGRRLVAFWRAAGVDTRWVSVDPLASTGIYVNTSTSTGHRFDYHRSGSAGRALEPAEIDAIPLDAFGVIHTTGIGLSVGSPCDDAVERAATRARSVGIRTSFAANARDRLRPDLDRLRLAAAAADVVFLSEDDAASLYGDVDAALAGLAGDGRELVLTLGPRGALVLAGELVEVAAQPIEVVDAAGAGDALAGAYLAGRLEGAPPAEALADAVVASTLSCTSFGCASSYPSAARVRAARAKGGS